MCVHGWSRAERSVRKRDVGKEKNRDVGEERNMSKTQEVERRAQLDFKIAWYTQQNSGALSDTMLTMLLMRKLKSTLTKV